jgi:uncharacterized protein (DUF983 family)
MNDFRRLLHLLRRALLLRCPNCGRATFAKGLLKTHTACRVCGLMFEHDDGFFLGAAVFGYTFTFLLGILPPIVLLIAGVWNGVTATVVAVALCATLPVLFFRHAKALWMAVYYWVVPGDLRPAHEEAPTLAERVGPADPALSELERLRLEEAIADLEGGRPVYRPGAR